MSFLFRLINIIHVQTLTQVSPCGAVGEETIPGPHLLQGYVSLTPVSRFLGNGPSYSEDIFH